MSPSTKIARIAVLLLTLLLLSGLAAFGSSPASSYGLDFGARDYAHDGLTWFEPDPLASKYYHLSPCAYCAGNPLKFLDKEGKTPDLAWDLVWIGIDTFNVLKSYYEGDTDAVNQNLKRTTLEAKEPLSVTEISSRRTTTILIDFGKQGRGRHHAATPSTEHLTQNWPCKDLEGSDALSFRLFSRILTGF